jgi:iron-sulfur cluster assembly protein
VRLPGGSPGSRAGMLTLTPVAAEAVRQLVASAPVDDNEGGMRITAGETSQEGTPLQLTLVDGPEPADENVEEGGAQVFVDSGVAPFLDDKVLDAQVQSGGVAFALREQGEDGLPDMDGRAS